MEKALGARKRHILMQFLAEAMAITFTGGICGIVLAYVVSFGAGRITLYSRWRRTPKRRTSGLISPLSFVVSTMILVIVGVISGMLPAIRAAIWIRSKHCATSNQLPLEFGSFLYGACIYLRASSNAPCVLSFV